MAVAHNHDRTTRGYVIDKMDIWRHAPHVNTATTLAIWAGGALAFVTLWQIFLTRRLRRGTEADPSVAFALVVLRLYARVFHRLTVEGREHLKNLEGPLVVVCNHGSPLDPFLVQVALPRIARWMMAADMMPPDSDMLWRFARVIAIDRYRNSPVAFMTAMRTLRAGHVVGIFPEGRIGLPTDRILPFQEGVGELVVRGKARVLLASITGTSDTDEILPAFLIPSRAKLTFIDVLEWPRGTDPALITEDLRKKLIKQTGYEAVDVLPDLPDPIDPFLA